MDANVKKMFETKLVKVMENLRKNQMEAYYVSTAAEVVELVKTLAPEGQTVSNGGSVTLEECGVMDLLKSGRYNYLDRKAPGIDVEALYRQVFSCDTYFMSSNAVTEAGELYNVDGNSNRVAALLYGPKSVIVIVGCNKLVPDLDAAIERVQFLSAPTNTARLGLETPCAKTGRCMDCKTPARICCNYVISRQQRHPGRVKVIFVGEALGY